MYLPPAVTWDVKPARCHKLAVQGLALCAGLLCFAFCVVQGWGIPSLVLLLALLVSVLLASRGILTAPSGQLNWDGAQWHWLGPQQDAVADLQCVLDLQKLMLVQLRCDQGGTLCLWLESPSNSERWLALRRAIVVGASAPEVQAAKPLAEA